MNRSAIVCLVLLVLVNDGSSREEARPIEEARLREAASKPLRLVQEAQGVWYRKKQTCASCHHQILPMMAGALARERGVPFDPLMARDVLTRSFAYLKDLDAIVQGYQFIDEIDEGWKLLAAHAAGVPPSLSTSAAARFLASSQRPDGSWYTMDARPPQSFSRITTTAVCAQGVRLYLPESSGEEKRTVLRRAREWLLAAKPRTTEERTFQLLGLLWTGADQASRAKVARQLQAEQREDGGWNQLSRLASDAYSTGEALYALHQGAGIGTTDPVYQRGLRFLLKTQQEDGSWRVESRLHPVLPLSPRYFDTGFPHGRKHQYSSIAGTTWATLALLLAVPPKAEKKPMPPDVPDLAPIEKASWIDVVLNGSVADLEKALDAGMMPNARTARGTTALMLAASDAAKVERLVARGARVDTRAESGATALMVAARRHGNTKVVRLLLEKGASARREKGTKVKNQASALFFAATNGDVEMVRVLLDAGAAVDERMHVLGQFHQSPLASATSRGDSIMVDQLLRRGANPNDVKPDETTPLGKAAINDHPATVKVLLARGARVDQADSQGMTPLLYAAHVDSGNTAVVEMLLGAGADRNLKDDKGRTALEVARSNGYTGIAAVLARKTPPRKAPPR